MRHIFIFVLVYFFFLEGLGIRISFELTVLFYREPAKRSLHCHISEMSVTIPKLFLRTVEAGATFEGHKYVYLVFITVMWIPVRWP